MPEPGSGRRRRCRLLATGALSLLLLTAAAPALATAEPADAGRGRYEPSRNVLLLHAYPRLSPAVVSVDEAFRSTLGAQSPFSIYFYTEYLDLSLFDGDTPQRELREELRALLHRKYASRGIDLIVAAGSRALRVALHNREDLFSGAPVVFVGVDRTGAVRRALRRLLDATGFRVETFSSAEEFLESEHRRKADCLVLDVHLGGLSGLDLQERLATSGVTAPVVIITAHDDLPTYERARRGGAIEYLPKPFDDDSLIDAIHKAIGDR